MAGSPVDVLLFAVIPYVAAFLAVFVTIDRYRNRPFTVSSLSAQFFENRRHFWGSVPFHYGILVVLAGHLLGLCIPRSILLWNRHPVRLYVLEATGLSFAVLALFGLANVVARRLTEPRNRVVTSRVDLLLFLVLFAQITTGIGISLFHGWGSSWFVSSATPYLWSLVLLAPRVDLVAPYPWLVKAHVAGAWLLLALVPYSRLVHILVAPVSYLRRRPQVVRWYADRSRR